MKESIRFLGGYSTLRVWERGKAGVSKPVYESTVHNLIVTSGKVLVADLLIGDVTTGLTYHAIGTGTDSPAVGDTTLTSEQERKAFTTRTNSSNEITLSCFYTAAQSTYNIKECGIFGGAASAVADSGTLFSHYLQSYDNSGGTYDLTFDYVLTIG